jgi:hypothetical protein
MIHGGLFEKPVRIWFFFVSRKWENITHKIAAAKLIFNNFVVLKNARKKLCIKE